MTKTATVAELQAALKANPETSDIDVWSDDDQKPEPTPNPLAALAQNMVRNRPSGDGHVGDPFDGMSIDVDPADAFGLVQANVTAWLEERGRWATPLEISHKAERLMAEAQQQRPGPVQAATYTVAPDGSVGDYTPIEAERELPGMPGHPEAPAAEPIEPSMLWDPAVWGTVVNPEHKATLIWPIPQTSKFDGQLLAAHDLDDLVDMLVRTVRPLGALSPLVISWYWKLKGGRSRGKPVLIRVREADKTLAYEKSLDVVVHLSADHLRKMKASALFVERLVFDALSRIDPAGPKVQPDDEWARLPGRWRYGWLGPEERLYAGLVSQIADGHDDDTTVDVDAVAVVTEDPVQNVMDLIEEAREQAAQAGYVEDPSTGSAIMQAGEDLVREIDEMLGTASEPIPLVCSVCNAPITGDDAPQYDPESPVVVLCEACGEDGILDDGDEDEAGA